MQEELDHAHRVMQDQLGELNAMKAIARGGKSAQKENEEQFAPKENEAKQKQSKGSNRSSKLDDSKAAARKKLGKRADAEEEEPSKTCITEPGGELFD